MIPFSSIFVNISINDSPSLKKLLYFFRKLNHKLILVKLATRNNVIVNRH